MKPVEEILKDIEKSGLKPGTHLKTEEIIALAKIDDEWFNLITNSFALGFYRGTRAERRRERGKK